MNITETLLNINKKYILSSIYQNTIYNGQKLCEYFGKEQQSKKEGKPFNELLYIMLKKFVPQIPLLKIIENTNIYNQFENCVIQINGRYGKIKDAINYFKNNDKIIIYIGTPSFFCRKYFLRIYDKNTKIISEEYIIDKEFSTNPKTKEFSKYFFYINIDDINTFFNEVNIEDYKKLKGLN